MKHIHIYIFLGSIFLMIQCTQRQMKDIPKEKMAQLPIADSSETVFVQRFFSVGDYHLDFEAELYSLKKDTFYLEGITTDNFDKPPIQEAMNNGGVGNVEIYLCKTDSKHYSLQKIKKLATSDCVGRFKISFQPNKEHFLVLHKKEGPLKGYAYCTALVNDWKTKENKKPFYKIEIQCQDFLFTRYVDKDTLLVIDLSEIGDSLIGKHFYTTPDGKMLDDGRDGISIRLKKTLDNKFQGRMKSYYDNKNLRVYAEIKGNELVFDFIDADHGFLPKRLTLQLKRQQRESIKL